ncbi:hypothetical protein VTK73DRAFT_655 [Phialemonium thermophilum]|uniref:FAS1 domain-containing protein n=1 Tax=Phialemonium thermophilum TaxID=223376 RepID=A0ABR3VUJ0_9PEZI
MVSPSSWETRQFQLIAEQTPPSGYPVGLGFRPTSTGVRRARFSLRSWWRPWSERWLKARDIHLTIGAGSQGLGLRAFFIRNQCISHPGLDSAGLLDQRGAMRPSKYIPIAIWTAFASEATAQDLVSVLSRYPQLTSFVQALGHIPGGITTLFPDNLWTSLPAGVTVLAPSNDAWAKFLNASAAPNDTVGFATVPPDQLLATLRYHVLAANLMGDDLVADGGLVVPTLLRDEQYNNRSAGADLIGRYGSEAAKGQVVYVSRDPVASLGPAAKMRRAMFRETRAASADANLRGGDAVDAQLQAIDAGWGLGTIQILDTVLVPPEQCEETIRDHSSMLSSLDTALNRTGLWTALNTARNVTCLAPTNKAFSGAGNPEINLKDTDLKTALLFHTLPYPLYTSYITSGATITSLAGADFPVTVTKVGEDIYFNDAKLLSPNVLTNNGLVHVLDRVMSPNGTAPGGPSSPSPSASTTPTPTSGGKENGGRRACKVGSLPGLLGCAVSVLLVA